MKAEIISIGTEFLLGELLDTNANYLAARLPALGIDLSWTTQVGDNLDRLTEVFRRAWDRSDPARATPDPRRPAPGWGVDRRGRILVAMPGPPPELERMWEAEVAPRLAELVGGGVIVSRTLKTAGIGGGTIDEMVSPL